MTRTRFLLLPLLLACLPLAAQEDEGEQTLPVPNAETALAADLDAPVGAREYRYSVRLGPPDAARRAEVTQRVRLDFAGGKFQSLEVTLAAGNRIEIGGSAPKLITIEGSPWNRPAKRTRLSARAGRLFLDEGGGERALTPPETATQKQRDESPLCWLAPLIGQDYRCRMPVGWLLERQLGLFDMERHRPRNNLLVYTGVLNATRARAFFSELDYDEPAVASLLRRFATVRVEADPSSGKLRAFAIRGMAGANPYEAAFEWDAPAPPAGSAPAAPATPR